MWTFHTHTKVSHLNICIFFNFFKKKTWKLFLLHFFFFADFINVLIRFLKQKKKRVPLFLSLKYVQSVFILNVYNLFKQVEISLLH